MTDDEDTTRQKIRSTGGISGYKPTSVIDQAVAARIAAVQLREAEAKRRRAELKSARDAGLRQRYAVKVARLARLDAQDTPGKPDVRGSEAGTGVPGTGTTPDGGDAPQSAVTASGGGR